jgi:hypothetical protein
MTNSHPPRQPSQKQLSYLRDLAYSRGQTFTLPHSRAEASAEIERLRGIRPQNGGERRSDAYAYGRVSKKVLQYAPAVREEEIEGYGSTARWR